MSEFDSQDNPDVNTDTFPLTAAQRRELDSRMESYLENPFSGSSWDEVKARLQNRPEQKG